MINWNLPMVGIVVTISPNLSLYRIVVLPAASKPTINILISFLPKRPLNRFANTFPMLLVLLLVFQCGGDCLIKLLYYCFFFFIYIFLELFRQVQIRVATAVNMQLFCGFVCLWREETVINRIRIQIITQFELIKLLLAYGEAKEKTTPDINWLVLQI